MAFWRSPQSVLYLHDGSNCLKTAVLDCTLSSSYSFVLTLAEYIIFHNPLLGPPGCPEPPAPIRADEDYGTIKGSLNLYFQPWCDYLYPLIQQREIFKFQDTVYIYSKVPAEYLSSVKNGFSQCDFDIEGNNIRQAILNELGISEKDVKTKSQSRAAKIGIMRFSTSQITEKKNPWRPKVNLNALLQGIFYENQDQWTTYHILKGQYPTLQDCQNLDAIVLTGSSLSINDDTKEIVEFKKILKNILDTNSNIKVLGLCFGHQLIAKLYEVPVKPSNRYVGKETIKFSTQAMAKHQLFQGFSGSAILCQFHSDYVKDVPEGMALLGSSKSCQNEAMISNDGRVLTFQFHMEYSEEFSYAYFLRVTYHNKMDKMPYWQKEPTFSEQHLSSIIEVRGLVNRFMRGDLQPKGKL